MPEIGNDERRPFSVADARRNWTNNFDLPTSIVERLCNSIVAPLPFHFRIIVENGIEFVEFEVTADIWEPGHGNDVAICCLDNTPFSEAFCSGVCGDERSTLKIRCNTWNPRVPFVTSVYRPYRIFTSYVEDGPLNRCGNIVFTAISSFRLIEHSPRHVGCFVCSQIHGHELSWHFMRLLVDEDIVIPSRFDFFRLNDGFSITETSCEDHAANEHHGENCPAHGRATHRLFSNPCKER